MKLLFEPTEQDETTFADKRSQLVLAVTRLGLAIQDKENPLTQEEANEFAEQAERLFK